MPSRPRQSKHVYIDGDIVCYSVGFASEQKDEEGNIIAEPVEYALSSVKRMIKNVVKACKAETYTVLLTGDGNFREEVATIQPYKGNRKEARKPTHYQAIRDYLVDHHNGKIIEGEEADDVLGYKCVEGYTIASIDKDLNNVPGWHYNWNKEELCYVTPREADKNFMIQMLVGDATDHIPGLFKMTGQRATPKLKERVTAKRTLRTMFKEVSEVWKEAYLSVGLAPDDVDVVVDHWLKEIATLLWISREEGQRWEDVL